METVLTIIVKYRLEESTLAAFQAKFDPNNLGESSLVSTLSSQEYSLNIRLAKELDWSKPMTIKDQGAGVDFTIGLKIQGPYFFSDQHTENILSNRIMAGATKFLDAKPVRWALEEFLGCSKYEGPSDLGFVDIV